MSNPNYPGGSEVDPSEGNDENREPNTENSNPGEPDPGTLEVDPSEAPDA